MTHEGQLVISVTDAETKKKWSQCRELVAEELDVDPDELTRWEVLRELTEAYSGGESLGKWRE